jgi:hypothetical protein
MRRVDLVIMSGWHPDSEAERMVDGVRRAIARDLIDKALFTGAFASIIVSTNDAVLAETVCGGNVVVEYDPPEATFHFGTRLQDLVAKYAIERVVYLGGGCAPLLPADALFGMAERVRETDRLFLANNFYSVDFCAFTPASALLPLVPPDSDNALGWLLGDEAGLPVEELPRETATSFDVDTPTDVLALSLHPNAPPRTRAYLDGLVLPTERIESAIAVLLDRQAEVLVAGRVNSRTMAYLESETVCRTRVFSEERGMRADGRLAGGKVRSLLGMHIERVGVERFFEDVVPLLGRAAFLDDRVIWAHHKVWPSAGDRFNSDLFRPADIDDPFVRRFTTAARACPVPVVLGGHSLVSGGLLVLVDAAWARSGVDLQRRMQ